MFPSQGSHLFQPPRPASLPFIHHSVRETVDRCGGNQHIWPGVRRTHRMQQPTLCSSGWAKTLKKSGLFLAEDVVKTCDPSRTKYDGVNLCTSLSSVRLSPNYNGLRRVPTLKPSSRTTVIFILLFTSVACETLHWLQKGEKEKCIYLLHV